jgi:hypothetical protein
VAAVCLEASYQITRRWNQNIAQLTAEKKKACLQFLQNKTEADHGEYKRIRAIVKRKTRRININSWDA